MDSIILVDIFEKSNHPFIYQTSEHHIPPRHRDLLSSFKSRKGFQGAPSMRGALEHMGAHGTRTCMKWYENDSRLWPLICLLISNFQVVKSDSESNCIEFLVAVKKMLYETMFFFPNKNLIIQLWTSHGPIATSLFLTISNACARFASCWNPYRVGWINVLIHVTPTRCNNGIPAETVLMLQICHMESHPAPKSRVLS